MNHDVILGSSLRAVPPQTTLERARRRASALGITRVTDITRLDRVGVPVFASIRPGAAEGSLCVNAGKGMTAIEAQVGAYMEAIEFALAEPGASHVKPVRATARDVLDGRRRPEAVLDLCPKLGARIRLDAAMDCVEAEDIATGEKALVPAELAFLPFHPRKGFRGIFGSSSNGLSSGNTVSEATVHGLCELVERDVRSFGALKDTSVVVDLDTVTGPPAELIEAIRAADLELHVRATRNAFGMAFFGAVVHDPEACSPHFVSGGYGCHLHRSVAFARAVTEALQSRLSFIHGGRDDLVGRYERFRFWTQRRRRDYVKQVVARAAAGTRVALEQVDDSSHDARDVEACERALLATLAANGFDKVYRVRFCAPDDELQVVRVVVPRMEMLSESVFRVGPRLREHAAAS